MALERPSCRRSLEAVIEKNSQRCCFSTETVLGGEALSQQLKPYVTRIAAEALMVEDSGHCYCMPAVSHVQRQCSISAQRQIARVMWVS